MYKRWTLNTFNNSGVMILLIFSTALKTDFPWYLDLSLSRSSKASWTPVEAPDGTSALNSPLSDTRSTYK